MILFMFFNLESQEKRDKIDMSFRLKPPHSRGPLDSLIGGSSRGLAGKREGGAYGVFNKACQRSPMVLFLQLPLFFIFLLFNLYSLLPTITAALAWPVQSVSHSLRILLRSTLGIATTCALD